MIFIVPRDMVWVQPPLIFNAVVLSANLISSLCFESTCELFYHVLPTHEIRLIFLEFMRRRRAKAHTWRSKLSKQNDVAREEAEEAEMGLLHLQYTNMRTYIPNHIIFGDILPLVPSEKLNEWKVACKSWYYHLHLNPSSFIRDQLAKSKPYHIFDMGCILEFSQHHRLVSSTLNVEFKLDSTTNVVNCISRLTNLSNLIENTGLPSYGTFIVGSCNGLVLVNQYSFPNFYLINPCTKQWVTLPIPHKRNMAAVTAFGYDKSSDKYKVLLFIDKNGFKCKLLTLGSKNWKSIKFPREVRAIRRPSVTMDGYMSLLCNVDADAGLFNHLLSFDIGRETFHLLKLPSICRTILAIHNSLAVVPVDGSSYKYYKLDRGNGSWIKEYSVPIRSPRLFIHPFSNHYFPLTTCSDGKTFVFEEVVGGRLYYFDEETISYRQIRTLWDRSHYSAFAYTLNHVDTLLSPCMVTSKKRKYVEDPDSASLLRRSLRLRKKSINKRV